MMKNICSICRIQYYDTHFKQNCVAKALNITVTFAHILTHKKRRFCKMCT